MRKRIKIAVLMGGKSPEHEISLISGQEVVRNLNPKKYRVNSLVISKQGEGLEKLLKIKPDVIFIAMHGPFGEDGTIQGMLEMLGIKYTGSRVLASAIGMNKPVFRKLMNHKQLAIPKYVVITGREKVPDFNKILGDFPYVVKPSAQGSSVGVFIVRNHEDLKKAIKNALKFGTEVIVEEYVKGIEVTCPVLGNDKPFALPVIEIIPKNNFFDYESKYSKGGAKEIVPARISKTITKKVQNIAIDVHKTLGCRGFSRVDFILKDNKTPVVLEINTIPGLTPMSLFPKSAKVAGISYTRLLDKIIHYASKK